MFFCLLTFETLHKFFWFYQNFEFSWLHDVWRFTFCTTMKVFRSIINGQWFWQKLDLIQHSIWIYLKVFPSNIICRRFWQDPDYIEGPKQYHVQNPHLILHDIWMYLKFFNIYESISSDMMCQFCKIFEYFGECFERYDVPMILAKRCLPGPTSLAPPPTLKCVPLPKSFSSTLFSLSLFYTIFGGIYFHFFVSDFLGFCSNA